MFGYAGSTSEWFPAPVDCDILIALVWSTRRGMRDRLQVTSHRRGTTAPSHPGHTGRDSYQHLPANSSSRCSRCPTTWLTTRCRISSSRYTHSTTTSPLAHATHDAANRTIDVQYGRSQCPHWHDATPDRELYDRESTHVQHVQHDTRERLPNAPELRRA